MATTTLGSEYVKRRMQEYGLTQKQLAEESGLSLSTVKNALLADTCTGKTAFAIAIALHERKRQIRRDVGINVAVSS